MRGGGGSEIRSDLVQAELAQESILVTVQRVPGWTRTNTSPKHISRFLIFYDEATQF